MMMAVLAIYVPTGGLAKKTTTVTVTSTTTSSTTTTETSTTTATSTSTSTRTQTQTQTQTHTQTVPPGAASQFSAVTIHLSNTASSLRVTTSCLTIAGFVWWTVGPIPPTAVWYDVAYANGTYSAQVPITLVEPFTSYVSDPPTPSAGEYNAANFSADVCGLQNSYVNAPFIEPNLITIYAQDPTNTFNVSLPVYKQ